MWLLRIFFILSGLLMSGIYDVFCKEPAKIIIISSSHTSQSEYQALTSMASNGRREFISLEATDIDRDKLKDADIVVFHRVDSSEFSKDELNLKESLVAYVRNGGNLYLSMEGVRLLNNWGVEPTPITVEYQEAVDNGFGRAVGFHAYREHPLFESLAGGAYTWKGLEDHMARTLGFSKGALPVAGDSKIIGINWAYIHYHEDRKLIWETSLGKGKILAVGAYVYYSLPNTNSSTLSIFTDNIFDYLAGTRVFKSKPREWIYDSIPVANDPSLVDKLNIPDEKFIIPESVGPTCVRESDKRHFWNVSGQQALVMGREKGSVEEVWIHPVMTARDLSVGVKFKNTDKILWLDTVRSKTTKSFEFMMREYPLKSGSLKEVFSASPSLPVITVNYEWNDPEIEEVYVTLTSNLRLMWPYSLESTGTLLYSVSQDGKVAAVCDRNKELNMVSVFSKKPKSYKYGPYDFSHKKISGFDKTPTKHKQVSFIWNFDGLERYLTLYIAGGEEGLSHSMALLNENISANQVSREISCVLEDFPGKYLMIESDDPVFNEAYRCALLSTDKLFCHTPSLGKSMMAGFWSTSRGWNGGHAVSGRPGYAWYFGRDTEWTGTVMNSYGDFEKVKDILLTFGNYQDPDGKIYHELTTSGSVHYDASDSTPLYLVLAGDYLRKSGDVDFIRSQWHRIMKALSFCRSTDTDNDGLIENTGVGHGWQESHQLHGAHTEIYLASIWAQALKECAYMATALGLDSIASRCSKEYDACKNIINRNFWNDSLQFFNHGLMKDGSYQTQKCVLGGSPLIFGLADIEKARITARNFPSKYYSTDWGVTMVGYDSPYYATGGYNYGNVWPFLNGLATLAEYNAGLRSQGFRHAFSCLRLYRLWDYGNIAEVILGDKLGFTGICPHQQWSSSMNLSPLYKGMLGLKIDALSMSMSMEPCFPSDWNYANVTHIPIADRKIGLNYQRGKSVYSYKLYNECHGEVSIGFSAILPLASNVKWVKINGKKVPFNIVSEPQNIKVTVGTIILNDNKEIEIGYSGGIGICLNLPELAEGMGNDGLKIEAEEFDEKSKEYTLHLSGRPGVRYDFKLLTLSDVATVEGSEKLKSENPYSFYTIQFPEGQEPFVSEKVKFKIK